MLERPRPSQGVSGICDLEGLAPCCARTPFATCRLNTCATGVVSGSRVLRLGFRRRMARSGPAGGHPRQRAAGAGRVPSRCRRCRRFLPCLRRYCAGGGRGRDPGHHRLPGRLAVHGFGLPQPPAGPEDRRLSAACGDVGHCCSMRVLRLPSRVGSMPAHRRLVSASAAGPRAAKLDSQTIRAPRPAGWITKRPRLSDTGGPPRYPSECCGGFLVSVGKP